MIGAIIFCLVLGYACGCISSGYIVGKVCKVDVRQHGSGNLGATNVMRTLGVGAGAITLLCDLAKCMIPLLLVRYVLFQEFAAFSYESQLLVLYTALGAVLGHNFPFYLKFHGGKGITCMGAVMLMFDWRLALFGIVTFVLIVAVTRYVSVASLFEATLFPIWVALMCESDLHMILVTCIFTISAFYTHRANIKRLINGNENKLGAKKKD
ncbi:MAG: glycerol-3-phosphate 1-O-acyltransferase PlsY [Lachnospiraceae bacterium]